MADLRSGFAAAMLAALVAGVPGMALAGDRPVRVTADFYGRLIHPDRPEPRQERFAAIAPFMGEELYRALRAYDAYERACARIVAADIKPHMIDQSPFFLAPDGAKTMLEAWQRVHGDVARVSVILAYDDVRWTDTVLLAKQRGRWAILDIRWQGCGSLTARLSDFAKYRCVP
ncbi:MAG: hypothetical protein HOQ32_11845 [Lysobacter sp.]|nr:hypothetical protein [Lysobacter sp.]